MKILKTMTAGFLACALVSSAYATANSLFLTGSTAFRANTINAILHVYKPNPAVTFAFVDNSSGTATVQSSNVSIFKGQILINGTAQPITIKCHFTGSEGGIQTTAGGLNVSYLSSSESDVPTSTGGTRLSSSQTLSDSHVPDVTMSDTYQQSSQFKAGATVNGVTFVKLNGNTKSVAVGPAQIVGVIPFQFVSSLSAPQTLTNMSSENARVLFSVGKAGLALFTGQPGDEPATVFATGRDIDSGTRLTTLADTGLGAIATVKQFQPRIGGVIAKTSGGTLDAPPYTIWPIETVNGITEQQGNGGYSSGGDLALALGNITQDDSSGHLTCFVSYLGVGDAAKAVGVGAHTLTFNGYDFSVNAIKEGQYTFWGYEHLYYRDDIDTTTDKQVADKLAKQIYTTDAPAPLYTDMNATRKTDGATVFPLY